jgi:hypothetical protein
MGTCRATGKQINKLQVLIGLIFLFAGSLIYLVDRPPDSTYFIYRFSFMLSLHNILHNTYINLFGYSGNFLPEFIHVFSFILLTAGVVSCGKRGYIIICISWLLVDALFELGQRYNSLLLKLIPDWFSEVPILESIEGYFRKGTFDVKDMIAIFTGAVTACIVLLMTMEKGDRGADRCHVLQKRNGQGN